MQEVANISKQAFHRYRLQLGIARTCELEEVAHEVFQPVNLVPNHLKVFVFGRAGFVTALEGEQPNFDGGERIANFVGDAGGKNAERRELFLTLDDCPTLGEIGDAFPNLSFQTLVGFGESVFGVSQRFLHVAQFCHVGVGPEPTNHFSVCIADRHGTREKPAIRAILASQRKSVLPRLSRIPRMLEACHHAIDVIGMVHLFPSPALHLFDCRARVIQPTLVVPENPTVRIGHPDQLGHIVRQRLKSFFTLAQCILRTLPLCDVAQNRGEQHLSPGFNCGYGCLDGEFLTVCAQGHDRSMPF